MLKSSKLIEDAMNDTVAKLGKAHPSDSDESLRSALEELTKQIKEKETPPAVEEQAGGVQNG